MTAGFRGASADAVAVLGTELGAIAPGSIAEVGQALFDVAATLRTEGALRRFVTDNSVPAEAKTGLVGDVLGGKLPAAALDLVKSAVSRRWTATRDLADALEHLSVVACVRSASADAARLSDELFEVGELVKANPELRDALSEPVRSQADKGALVDSLLAGKALPATLTLVKQALSGSYRTVTAALAAYEKVAAEVHGEGVATVRVARDLSAADRSRLADALARQYGRPVHLNLVIDPSVIGGIRVEIGDDVIDGTVVSRLDDARRRLAG